jgi:ParB/RepB/Spo0J family partition protein
MKKANVDELRNLPVDHLQPHPQNPRRLERRDVIEGIAAQLREAEFHPSHAILVRPYDGKYQIISGHHRVKAAAEAGIKEIPAWVRNLDDGEAFMQLILCNAQGQLHPLERGEHARQAVASGMTLRAYAERIGEKEQTVQNQVQAARVAVTADSDFAALKHYMMHLAVIHAAPSETWPQWVARLLENKWTVEELRDELKQAKKAESAPPAKKFFRVAEWEALSDAARERFLQTPAESEFNAQESSSIEWARWSWNPVTGCLHNCPYCYARDIAQRFYAQGFDPSLIPGALKAPGRTQVPPVAKNNPGFQNVFVCSMADLFGKWVPNDWIEAVLGEVRDNPQWNFLFLTKFPQRMAEFEYPKNAWLGTSVDLQARVKNAERAMAKVKAAVRWLSLEPLLDPIEMDWALFQWIVIGGASASRETPDWQPPKRWLWDITFAAQAAGCAVYHKDNLVSRLRDYPGAIEQERAKPPAPFHYLKVLA